MRFRLSTNREERDKKKKRRKGEKALFTVYTVNYFTSLLTYAKFAK